MISEKKASLLPIFESAEGVHLTIYLVNRGNLIDLKRQLRESLREVNHWLQQVLTSEERRRFLEPLDKLLSDTRIFKGMKSNIGIFRNKDSFRILSVPVELERQCHLASSFHIKPLLRWMQVDREFLLLGLKQNSAHLYLGSQTAFQKVDSIIYPEPLTQKRTLNEYTSFKESRELRLKQDEAFAWLNEWLEQMTQKTKPKLFLAGEKPLVEGFLQHLNYKNVIKLPIALSFGDHNLSDSCFKIRQILKAEARSLLEQSLLEFRFAYDINLAKKNIFQIAKLAVQGRVKKLIIAADMNIFGKMDKKTGGLAIHPFDLDHEDDDLLDDLAQLVLASGGEVVVARRDEIPKGRVALALLDQQGTGAEKINVLQGSDILREKAAL